MDSWVDQLIKCASAEPHPAATHCTQLPTTVAKSFIFMLFMVERVLLLVLSHSKQSRTSKKGIESSWKKVFYCCVLDADQSRTSNVKNALKVAGKKCSIAASLMRISGRLLSTPSILGDRIGKMCQEIQNCLSSISKTRN